MTQEHLITPPPELVQQWAKGARLPDRLATEAQWQQRFATQAAQWGADQELEACCVWMADETPANYIEALRAARRPKPPSLKEQALAMLDDTEVDAVHYDTIRKALEQLDD